jgi:hypothetical protein
MLTPGGHRHQLLVSSHTWRRKPVLGWPPTDTGITDQDDRLPFPDFPIDQPCQYLNFTLWADKSRLRHCGQNDQTRRLPAGTRAMTAAMTVTDAAIECPDGKDAPLVAMSDPGGLARS